ncbi:MAG: 2-dehydropantoate 2-reductase N-terminal domain-containing protein [Oscillospiraceae bacterium]|nr:2-dehydropantoate 2-reductase N-terminal domain-containing protein [Oscillospiraceae bacterium]
MRILIYGAGVIGSLYAALFASVDFEVSLVARGNRLAELRKSGLRYWEKGKICTADVTVKEILSDGVHFDYIFLTVRAEQAEDALKALQTNQSPTIVTMVNSLTPYAEWEALCGKGRILPAFPGAGGGWRDGALDAALTPYVIQPTTFGEIDGRKTPRAALLKRLFQTANIPCQIVSDMHLWQLCHLAMVVPLADAYYNTAGDPALVYQNKPVLRQAAEELRHNFRAIKRQYGALSPAKMNLFRVLPTGTLRAILSAVYKTSFADRFMYQHAMKAPEEMRRLHEEFYGCIGKERRDT